MNGHTTGGIRRPPPVQGYAVEQHLAWMVRPAQRRSDGSVHVFAHKESGLVPSWGMRPEGVFFTSLGKATEYAEARNAEQWPSLSREELVEAARESLSPPPGFLGCTERKEP